MTRPTAIEVEELLETLQHIADGEWMPSTLLAKDCQNILRIIQHANERSVPKPKYNTRDVVKFTDLNGQIRFSEISRAKIEWAWENPPITSYEVYGSTCQWVEEDQIIDRLTSAAEVGGNDAT